MQAFDYHLQASKSVRKLAVWSRQTIQSSAFRNGDGRMLIELRRGGPGEQDVVWDSMFVHAVNPGVLLYDRRPEWKVEKTSHWTLQEAGNPTILSGSPDDAREALRSRRIEFVIAYSDAARNVLEAIMKPVDDARTYADDPSAAVTASRAWIQATPNPVPLGPGTGSTTVSWATGDPEGGHVYVSLNGDKGRLFASGASGSQEAPWIGAGTAYEFQLYSSRNTLLSAVTVERRATESREYRVYTWRRPFAIDDSGIKTPWQNLPARFTWRVVPNRAIRGADLQARALQGGHRRRSPTGARVRTPCDRAG